MTGRLNEVMRNRLKERAARNLDERLASQQWWCIIGCLALLCGIWNSETYMPTSLARVIEGLLFVILVISLFGWLWRRGSRRPSDELEKLTLQQKIKLGLVEGSSVPTVGASRHSPQQLLKEPLSHPARTLADAVERDRPKRRMFVGPPTPSSASKTYNFDVASAQKLSQTLLNSAQKSPASTRSSLSSPPTHSSQTGHNRRAIASSPMYSPSQSVYPISSPISFGHSPSLQNRTPTPKMYQYHVAPISSPSIASSNNKGRVNRVSGDFDPSYLTRATGEIEASTLFEGQDADNMLYNLRRYIRESIQDSVHSLDRVIAELCQRDISKDLLECKTRRQASIQLPEMNYPLQNITMKDLINQRRDQWANFEFINGQRTTAYYIHEYEREIISFQTRGDNLPVTEYVIQRARTLAANIQMFKFLEDSKPYIASAPMGLNSPHSPGHGHRVSDAEIVMHNFLARCDTLLGQGDPSQRLFTRKYFVDESTSGVHLQEDTAEPGRPTSRRSHLQIVCVSVSPPHYMVRGRVSDADRDRDRETAWNIEEGRSNVFMCILTFLYLVGSHMASGVSGGSGSYGHGHGSGHEHDRSRRIGFGDAALRDLIEIHNTIGEEVMQRR